MDETFKENYAAGVEFMTAPVISVPHAFTTRRGGVSEGIFESLNLGENRGDEPENVRENYRLLGEATGIDLGHCAFTRQVHGNEVRIVTSADVHELFSPVPYEADGIVTNDRGLALFCFTADCVPVLLCDDKHGVIAAVHCGWRSTVADILGNAVAKMETLGAVRADICAAIGPAIDICHFEVGPEVVEACEKLLGGPDPCLWGQEGDKKDKFLLDLKGVNRARLIQLGLNEDNICVSDECTYCLPEKYWSHRYTQGERGSQGAVIVLK